MNAELMGAVLCGGLSRRMGRNKALLEVRPGVRQIDYAVGLLGRVCTRVVACTGPAGRSTIASLPGIAEVPDRDDVQGPMAGIIAALVEAQGLGIVALACDMPWVDEKVIATLLNGRDTSRLATAFVANDGKPEPMCALYEATALGPLTAFAAGTSTSLRAFLASAPIAKINLDNSAQLASVNDPTQLAQAREEFASNPGSRN